MSNSTSTLPPFHVRHTGKIEPIRRAAVIRRRAQPANRRKTVNVHALSHQVIGDIEHDDLADENGIRAQRLLAVQFALHACL